MESNEKNQHFLCELCLDDRFLAEGKAWTKKKQNKSLQTSIAKAQSFEIELNLK